MEKSKKSKSNNNNMEGTNPTGLEGTRPLTGPALPNLINAVGMLKSTSTSKPPRSAIPAFSGDRDGRPYNTNVSRFAGFDFKHFDRIYKVG